MKTALTIILLIISFSLFSQKTKIDSLQQKLLQAKGHEQIVVLNDLAYAYGYVDVNKSINLAKEALHLAETQKYNKAKALTYDILGRAYFISGNNKVAEVYYDKCISTANKYGTEDDIYKALRHKILIYANSYQNNTTESLKVFKQFINATIKKQNYADFLESLKIFIYVFYNHQSNNSIITKYLFELKNNTKNNNEFIAAIFASEGFYLNLKLDFFGAIERYEKALALTKDVNFKASSMERVGNIYFEVRKYKESIKYYNKALLLAKNNEFPSKKILLYLLKADLGASYLQLKDYKAALPCLKSALENPSFSNRDKGAILNNLGSVYLSINNLDSADYYLNKALIVFKSLGCNCDYLAYLHSKAKLLIRKQQWNELSVVINEISNLANDVKDYYVLFDSYQLLSDYYEKSGNYKKSNEYLKKWITANDSINNRELVNKISELEFKYETEKKVQQINLQQRIIKQKDQFIVFAVIAGSLISIAMLVIFILYRIRNKAYKQLVYQSLENSSKAQILKIEDNTDEEDTIGIKNANSVLDESLKTQIEILLNKQLDAKVYLESNLILKTLAEKCDTNRNYLSQFINERYAMNFNTFINMLRINEAKKLLADKNNDLPLKELCLKLGYNSYSVFNEAFKKNIGVTPAFYLKTIKNLVDGSNPS